MRIPIQMVYAGSVERGCPTFDAMNFISLFQQKFSQISAVLPGNTRDECAFLCHDIPPFEIIRFLFRAKRFTGKNLSSTP